MNKNTWNVELHALIEEFCSNHQITQTQLLSFLATTLVRTMEIYGISEEFAEATFDRMKETFKKKRNKRLSS